MPIKVLLQKMKALWVTCNKYLWLTPEKSFIIVSKEDWTTYTATGMFIFLGKGWSEGLTAINEIFRLLL